MDPFDLDRPLIELVTSTEKTYWTIRHAVEGVQVFGGIGSGKTSGSGRLLALKYLSAGFGGLVLTVKPDEKQAWQEYARLTKREKDLVILEPGGAHSFNFLEYEAAQAGGQEAITENIVQVLKTVIRAGEEKDSGKNDDAFWEKALDMLIFNVIDLCKLAYGTVSIQQLYDIVQTIPKDKEEAKKKASDKEAKAFEKAFGIVRKRVITMVNAWEDSLPKSELDRLKKDPAAFEEALVKAIPEARLSMFLDQFFTDNFITLNSKTRSIIDFTFSGFLFRLLREPIYSLFCQNPSTVTPEDCLKGKIILVNLPVKLYHKAGRDCQILMKYSWQRFMEKRDVTKNPRPMFLWADEAQNFLHEHDADYQATARSSRIATVYISQNLPNYYACMGGKSAENRVNSFLGTLGTKIFHANADLDTNQYASALVGETFFENKQRNDTVANDSFSRGSTVSLTLERAVRPEEFVSLKTGGPNNNYRVEGYLHRQGDPILKRRNHIKMSFNQKYQP